MIEAFNEDPLDRIEMVASFTLSGTHYLGIPGVGLDSQWGQFAVYAGDEQIAEFAITEAKLRPELRPAELPVSRDDLVTLAIQTLTEDEESSR